jgi:hypothetical protein
MGKQQYAVFVLFALIIASSLTSYGCYSCMSRLVNEDMDRALALTMQEQQSDVICQDTIHTFNSHLQIADLRGKATLAVETRGKCFKAYAHCSEATIFGLSDQRPAMLLWTMSFLWALFMWYKRQQGKANLQPLTVEQDEFGGLRYSEADDQWKCSSNRLRIR